ALWRRAAASIEGALPHAAPGPQALALRRWALFLAAVALWQAATGVSNVVLGWPLLAAVSHTGGAAALVVGLATLWMQARSVESRVLP
ncbi:MAG: heme A synthase, partial [Betaproteobacteria bacterium]|nr:heme A synthase [Betaproteobacteria bacterium]